MKDSSFQIKIYDTWEYTDENILISATAGSGKTTTLLGMISKRPGRYLFLAFNNSIAKEINEKLQSIGAYNCSARTLHSFGLEMLRNAYKVKIDDGKYLDWLFKQCKLKYTKNKENNYKVEKVVLNFKLLSSIAYYVNEMFKFGRLYNCLHDIDKIETILLELGNFPPQVTKKEYYTDVYNLLVSRYLASLDKSVFICDFVDMIFLPVYLNLDANMSNYDYLLMDEVQDFNVIQHMFVDKLSEHVNKWVAVGDENQSIYGFAGSFTEAFSLFRQKPNVVELPLSVCYRCPSEVVELMEQVWPNCTVAFKEPSTEKVIRYIHFDDMSEEAIPDGTLIICRNSGPLFELYFKLISNDRNVVIKGSDISGKLNSFLRRFKDLSIIDAKIKMETELLDLLDKKGDSKLDFFKWYSYNENVENFEKIHTHLAGFRQNINELIEQIKTIFSTKKNPITLMTIHKSKGLEADFVIILDENLIPSSFATTPEQIKQELNLKFVARSRAKKILGFMRSTE